MPTRKVAEGDDIVSLAEPTGVPWNKVWAHSQNDALRRKRASPHLLAVGDEVFLPELEKKTESAPSDTLTHFKAKGDRVRFRVRLFERKTSAKHEQAGTSPSEYVEPEFAKLEEKAVASTAFELFADGVSAKKGKTDANGYADIELPSRVREGLLVLNPGDAAKERRIDLKWRHLGPVEELSGVCQRLTNLGIPCPPRATAVTPQIEDAVAAFQQRRGLDPTGRIDAKLRDELVKAHGS